VAAGRNGRGPSAAQRQFVGRRGKIVGPQQSDALPAMALPAYTTMTAKVRRWRSLLKPSSLIAVSGPRPTERREGRRLQAQPPLPAFDHTDRPA